MPVRNGEEWVLKAIQSVPDREDVETIVIDDCSEDGTYDVVKLFKKYSGRNIILIKNDERKFCGGSLNVGIEHARGEYIVQLDCDDFFYTGELNFLLNEGRTEDLIFFRNDINDGTIFDPETNKGLCDHMCFYKKKLIGDTRYGSEKWRMGWPFHNEILAKVHTEYYSHRVVYHYNFPREGSNYDLGMKGLL